MTSRKKRKEIRKKTKEAKQDLKSFIDWGFRILYLDETMITKTTIPDREYSSKYKNVELDFSKFSRTCVACLVAVS